MSSTQPAARPRILSGIQPTSDTIHLGNYLGAVRQWAKLQDDFEPYFFIANQHAITVEHDPKQLRERTYRSVAQLLAAGVDPEHSAIFVQSHVPEHSQLAWVMECLTGMGEARRMTQFKDKSAKLGEGNVSVGLLTYPMLMAADILLYRPQYVPVGEDQRQHLEITRNLAQRFNHRFKKTFKLPEAYIPAESAKIMDLQDPTSKMSKSASSPTGLIDVLDEPSRTAKKIRSAVTDSLGEVRYDVENQPGLANLLSIYSVLTGDEIDTLVGKYAGRGYGDLKKDLAEVVVEFVTPFRDRTLDLLDDRAYLDEVMAGGRDRARAVAQRTLADVYDRVGFVPAPVAPAQ